ncbi:THO complex subunit 5 homolog [Cylas formicarius]|uniref:THO complex subunit 5 homolog n=1 Tax=Cylas formicarius TaxID=197179 RepID=UPI002958D6E1|nr:THO complex subunit 5 homolog [Cylas formicarius]
MLLISLDFSQFFLADGLIPFFVNFKMVREGSSNLKKKRKTNSTDGEKEVDVYKKVCELEEKEATNHVSGEYDSELYYKICRDISKVLSEVRDLKYNQDGEIFENKQEYLMEIGVKVCLLKKLNRIDKLGHVFGRESLNVEKQKCDSIKLNYQNLVYEMHHLLQETKKCLSFISDDEHIDLVPVEDFMNKAPKSVTSKFEKIDKNDPDQEHALRLARLEWELTQCKDLAEECKVMEAKKKSVLTEITERKEKLNSLAPLLREVLKSTKPLLEHLGMTDEQTRQEHKLAVLLPEPLYILYANTFAYKNVYGKNINIEIAGDKEEAVQWKEAQEVSNSSSDGLNNDDSEPESDLPELEEVVEVKKRRHRKSIRQVDPLEEKKKKLLEAHPLKIQISMTVKEGPTLNMTFAYYTKLKIVAVTSNVIVPTKITAVTASDILAGGNILSELLDDDDKGLESPNPSTTYQLQKNGMGSFQSLISDIGYPFRWAQRICGIDFLAARRPLEQLSQQNVETVMSTLLQRMTIRTHLAKQMQDLEHNILPNVPATIEFPANTVAAVSKWKSIMYQDYCKFEFVKHFVEEELVTASDLFYSVNIVRGGANLQALIAIKNGYPTQPPIFGLSLNYNGVQHSANSDEIRDLERVLNVNSEHGSQSVPWLLALQLTNLCSYMDVYLESIDPSNFPSSTKFIRAICGRNRRRPLKFRRIGTGLFTQY